MTSPTGFTGTSGPADARPIGGRYVAAASAPDGAGTQAAAYAAYRRREAQELLALLPRDAVRTFYAEARVWARSVGAYDPKDPMVGLLSYCEHLLPLPPLEVWRETAGDAARPASRTFGWRGTTWTASLGVAPADGGRWRGFLAFRREEGGASHRTSNIFLEGSPESVHDRFDAFDRPSLQAFLRSVLP